MGRILFWLLAGLAAYLGYKWLVTKQRPSVGRAKAEAQEIEAMVSCSVCGLNLPQSEALQQGERWYCSEEHRRRDARQREA
jgi:uncharacterized protein